LAYADDVNIVGVKIHTIKKNIKALLDTRKGAGLAVNPEKTKCMLMSRSERRKKYSMKIVIRCFENVAKFRCFRINLIDQNCMHEDIKSRLNSRNACCHSVHSLLSSRLLSGNAKVKI
jgi:hypothetical protein